MKKREIVRKNLMLARRALQGVGTFSGTQMQIGYDRTRIRAQSVQLRMGPSNPTGLSKRCVIKLTPVNT